MSTGARFWKIKGRGLLLLALLLGAAAALLAPTPARGQEGTEGPTLSISAGLDGYGTQNGWLPVRVLLENNGPDLEAELRVASRGFNNREIVFSQVVSLPRVSRKELFLYVYPEAFLGSLEVELFAGGRKLAQASDRLTTVGQEDRLYLVLAGQPGVFNFLSQLKPPNGNSFTAFLQPDELPDHYLGLSGVDYVLLSGVDSGAFNPAQRQALEAWVARGGTLLISGGPAWRQVTSGLEALLPLQPRDEVELEDFSALAGFLGLEEGPQGQALAAAGTLQSGAQALLQQGELPLAARRAYGSGEVIFLTLDPSLEPLSGWQELPQFVELLLAASKASPVFQAGFRFWDLAQDAAAALPNLGLPSGWTVVCFLGLYILAVGPLNYFLLKRLKRRELAWVSIPLLVVLFAGLAFTVGSSALGNRPVLNHRAVVQVWPGVEQAQVDALLGVFSPSRERLTLESGPGFLAHGLQANMSLSEAGSLHFRRDEEGRSLVPEMRLDVGGVRTLALEGQIPAPRFEGELTLTLGPQRAALHASLSAPQGLPLEDAALITAGTDRHLGDLSPGQAREVDLVLTRLLKARPSAFSGTVPPYYLTAYADASLAEQILGTNDFYSDPEIYPRYALISALNDPVYGTQPEYGSFFLAGWSPKQPFEAGLQDVNFETSGESLYLFHLSPQIRWEGDEGLLPPALFTWEALTTPYSGSPATPYDAWLDPEGFALRFRLALPIEYSAVKSLILTLERGSNMGSASGSSPSRVGVSLWDFESQGWDDLGELAWGNHDLPNPERYVGPGGQVLVRLAAVGTFGQVQIGRADFTLVVER